MMEGKETRNKNKLFKKIIYIMLIQKWKLFHPSMEGILGLLR
jgi:hypothetical protein